MSKKRSARAVELSIALRHLRARTQLFGDAVARRMNINATDLECGEFLLLEGSMTAGRLAQIVDLTTGAITGVLRHLERAGFIKRQPDPSDARKVVVEIKEERLPELDAIFAPLNEDIAQLCKDYTDDELRTIVTFCHRASSLFGKHTALLRVMRE